MGPAIVPDRERNRKSWGLPAGSVREATVRKPSLEPRASWPRVAGWALKDGPVLRPRGWADAVISENWGGARGRGGALRLGDVALIRSALPNQGHFASQPNPPSPAPPATPPSAPSRAGPFPEVRPPKP